MRLALQPLNCTGSIFMNHFLQLPREHLRLSWFTWTSSVCLTELLNLSLSQFIPLLPVSPFPCLTVYFDCKLVNNVCVCCVWFCTVPGAFLGPGNYKILFFHYNAWTVCSLIADKLMEGFPIPGLLGIEAIEVKSDVQKVCMNAHEAVLYKLRLSWVQRSPRCPFKWLAVTSTSSLELPPENLATGVWSYAFNCPNSSTLEESY